MGPGEWRKYRNRKDITLEQGLAVKERATLAQNVAIEARRWGRIVKSRTNETYPNIMLYGETPEGFPANDWVISDGRAVNDEDVNLGRNVIVLGKAVKEKLFPYTYPIDEVVKIDGAKYTVIGLLEEKGSIFGGNQDNFVMIPLSSFLRFYGKDRSLNIIVQARSKELLTETQYQVTSVLRVARKVPVGQEDDFAIFSNDSLIQQFNNFTLILKLGIAVVSLIALLAAGVGIMNIMLVSVTERTREIGVRKAVGATKRNILSQFVIEAIVLCEIGGIIGILVGILGGNVAALLLNIPPIFPYDWAAIGLVVCSVVGIIFGVYPAWKAANLDPIESLRYE
jgi:putative ABC transport system permease protein